MMKYKIQEIINEIDAIVSIDFSNLVDWHNVSDWPIGETRNISGTMSTKTHGDATTMGFITIINPGDEFPQHWHDFAETCKVLGGTLCDKVSGRIWKQGETAIFSRGQKHIPYNPNDVGNTYLHVRFSR